MKTLALLFSLLVAAVHCAPVYSGMSIAAGQGVHTHSDENSGGTLGLTTTLSSSKACAANFTRLSPNYCAFTGNVAVGGVSWDDSTACTVRTPAGSLPSDAKAVHLLLHVRYLSNNEIGQRANDVRISNSGCSTAHYFFFFNLRESAAVAAGTVIGETTLTAIVHLTSGSFSTQQLNAGGNGNAEVDAMYTLGYFD